MISIVQLGSFFYPSSSSLWDLPTLNTHDALFSSPVSSLLSGQLHKVEISLLLSLFVLHPRQIKGIIWRRTLLFLESEIPSILFRPVKSRVFCSRLSPRGTHSPRLKENNGKKGILLFSSYQLSSFGIIFYREQQLSVF